MNGLTRVFLVLLRLAIGWHFLFEGLEKVESVWKGPTETNRPFTSEGYWREASGPLGEVVRRQIGDPDEMALSRFDVKPFDENLRDEILIPRYTRISPSLEKDMDAYYEQFVEHYHLDELQKQLALAKLLQNKDQAVRWLLEGSKDVQKPIGSGTFVVKQTTGQRIAAYKAKLQELRDVEAKELPAFGHDVEKQNLRALKAEVGRMRSELLTDLTQPFKDALQSVLTDDQKKGFMPETISPSMADWSRLQWIDWITRWGLVVVGAGLLLGLFTRTACVGGAIFLLLLYLSVPPFPWLPEPTRVEGHYYYVNKNLIEMLALLVLATTRSGCWLGLDGLLQWLNPWRRRRQID